MTDTLILNEKNRPQIEQALSEAQKRARARCLGYRDLERGAEYASNCLNDSGVASRREIGAKALVRTGDVVPNSYKGIAYETVIELVRRSTGWAFVRAYRDRCPSRSYGGSRESVVLGVTEEQAAIIAAHALKQINAEILSEEG